MYGGRWNSPGRRVVYVSETRALGTLEVLAGLQSTSQIPDYVAFGVRFEGSLVTRLDMEELPDGWDAKPPTTKSQGIGDRWLDNATSAILKVPSVIVPAESNYLLNPAHPDFRTIEIAEAEDLDLDPRLFNRP